MDFSITLMGDGALFGFTYFAVGDRDWETSKNVLTIS